MASITVPKRVKIENVRLALMYWILFAIALVFNVYRFIRDEAFSEMYKIGTMAFIGVNRGTTLQMMSPDVYDEAVWQPLCKNAESSEVDFRYQDLDFRALAVKCITPCPWSRIPERANVSNDYQCFTLPEVVLANGAQDLYMTTSEQHYRIIYNASNNERQSANMQRVFMPSMKYATLVLSYTYNLEQNPGFFFGLNPKKTDVSGDAYRAWTVIMKTAGRADDDPLAPWLVFPPGRNATMEIIITDLVHMHSGSPLFPISLDHSELPESVLRDGREYHHTVHCYDNKAYLKAVLDWTEFETLAGEKVEPSDKQPVCLMYFQIRADTSILTGKTLHTTYAEGRLVAEFGERSGVRIFSKAGSGYFRYPNLNISIANIISLIVMLGLPVSIVQFFMLYCLGHISKVYRQVTREDFSLIKALSSWSVGLMASSAVFEHLADLKEHESDAHGVHRISNARFAERLNVALRRYGNVIGPEERANIVSFAVNELSKGDQEDSWHLLKRVSLGYKRKVIERSDSVGGELGLDMNGFNKAVSTSNISFRSLVQLMDQEEKRRPLERIFMPREIREMLHAPVASAKGKMDSEAVLETAYATSYEEHQKKKTESMIEELLRSGVVASPTKDLGSYDNRIAKLEVQMKRLAAACSVWASSTLSSNVKNNVGNFPPPSPASATEPSSPTPATVASATTAQSTQAAALAGDVKSGSDKDWETWRRDTTEELRFHRKALHDLISQLEAEKAKNARLTNELSAALRSTTASHFLTPGSPSAATFSSSLQDSRPAPRPAQLRESSSKDFDKYNSHESDGAPPLEAERISFGVPPNDGQGQASNPRHGQDGHASSASAPQSMRALFYPETAAGVGGGAEQSPDSNGPAASSNARSAGSNGPSVTNTEASQPNALPPPKIKSSPKTGPSSSSSGATPGESANRSPPKSGFAGEAAAEDNMH